MNKSKIIGATCLFISAITIFSGCGKSNVPKTEDYTEDYIDETGFESVVESGELEILDFGNSQPGDIIMLGSYEQDADETNGKESIEWLVLKKESNRILVVSRYALDCKPYNDTITDVTWETCTLRKWLNEEFYNTAFSDADKVKIPATIIENNDNRNWGTEGGENTTDYVFCLSNEETEEYFGEYELGSYCARESLLCIPTQYAMDNGAPGVPYDEEYASKMGFSSAVVGNRYTSWWLRTPGHRSDTANIIDYLGTCMGTKKLYGNPVDCDINAVRPAIYVSL